jgi:H+/gluconate symporter-like permease/2-methylisocitrate lyase-like PEP mutase family enzyme
MLNVKRKSLKEILSSGKQMFVPCVYDCLSAKAMELCGFDGLLLSGGAMSYVFGVKREEDFSADEMIRLTEGIAGSVSVPLVIDAADGHAVTATGVYRNVRRLARAGAAGLTIDDGDGDFQITNLIPFQGKGGVRGPKDLNEIMTPFAQAESLSKMWGRGFRRVIEKNEYLEKIHAAVEACRGTDCMVIARTECYDTYGFDEVVDRINAARKLGAGMWIMLDIIIIIAALLILMVLTLKKFPVPIAVLISVVIMAIFTRSDILTTISESYMGTVIAFIKPNWLVLLSGVILSKVMDSTGAAFSLSKVIIKYLGAKRIIPAIMFSGALLAYGGIDGLALCFAIYPIALGMFRQANIPRYFIPAALTCALFTWVMCMPGAPVVTNFNASNVLGTSSMAGAPLGIVAAVITITAGTVVGIGGVIGAIPGFNDVIGIIVKGASSGGPSSALTLWSGAIVALSGLMTNGMVGLMTALNTLKDPFLTLGIAPEAPHRIGVIACAVLDCMPYGGGVVALFTLTKISYKDGYKHVAITAFIPMFLALVVSVILGSILYG